MFHEQTQPTTAQLMRCETAALSATAAQLSVAGTIGTLPAHGLVVLFDFDYSCRAGQFDTDGEIFLNGGSEDRSLKGLAPPFSCARRLLEPRQGAGF